MKSRCFPLILFILAFAACSKLAGPRVDQVKFEPVYRAAKSIQGATGIGLNYPKLGELVQNFATEILIAKDRANSDAERLLVTRYAEALQIFKDSLTLWQVQIDSARYEWIKGYILCEAEVSEIAVRYKLPIEDKDLAGVGKTLPLLPASSIQLLWQKADAKIQEGNEIYSGKGDSVKR